MIELGHWGPANRRAMRRYLIACFKENQTEFLQLEEVAREMAKARTEGDDANSALAELNLVSD
jgi:hypothetical protein